jgi:cytochrome P450
MRIFFNLIRFIFFLEKVHFLPSNSCQSLVLAIKLQNLLSSVNNYSICREPKYWDEAEVFKPHRFEECTTEFMGSDFCYTAYGAGRRICPGIAFALANMELFLAALLFHFEWQLPPGVIPSELDMEGASLPFRMAATTWSHTQ